MTDPVPDKVIDVPGVGAVAFPGSMTDAQINAAATRVYQDANPGKKQPPVKSWVDTAVDWLPTAGALVGGTLGASAGPLGAAGGAALGGAGGEAWKQNINRLRGAEAPATPIEAATAIGSEGLQDAALTAAGAGALKLASRAKAAGPAIQAVGKVAERVGESPAFRKLSRGGAILYGIATGDARTALEGGIGLPPIVAGAGKVIGSIGGKMAESAASKNAVLERLARIPVAERLAKIGMEAVEHAPKATADTIPGDVGIVRDLVAKGFSPKAALKIGADGNADYGSALTKAWEASIEKEGLPIPESVRRLMQSPSFAKLPQ